MRNISREEFDFGIKEIEHWYKSNTNTLSIITAPFNISTIFCDIILKVIKNKKKVMYVFSGEKEDRKLIEKIRSINKSITYCHIKNGTSNSDITFVDFKNIDKINDKYELVIFDDISGFSRLSNYDIKSKYEVLLNLSNRLILYLSESVINFGDKFELVNLSGDKPFVEPRFITTRVNLNNDIPYILYDYLKWFRDNKKNIVIYVPSDEKVQNIYDYYLNKLKFKGVKLIPISKKTDKKSIKNVLKSKDKSTFIITNLMEESLLEYNINNAVVLFADSTKYIGKNLLYMCGALGKINTELPEVLFVSNDISYDMDYAKEKARDFNKMIWEKRLLKL